MSSKIILDNISVINNPALFIDNIEFQITFTAIQPIPSLLEWRLIYVGSAKNQQCDQILEEFQIGPILQPSTMKFAVECPPPDHTKIPADQLICVTAIILTVSYKNQQFIRVGYYVHNMLSLELSQQQRLTTAPAELIKHTKRTILTDKPRITKFRISWANEPLMKEENISKADREFNSKNSLLANKVGLGQIEQNSQKACFPQQKDQNSYSLMKSETNEVEEVKKQLNMIV